jgi:O-antigen ligase
LIPGLILLVITLLLTHARGGWLATLAGLITLLILAKKKLRILTVVILIFLILMVMPRSVENRLGQIFGGTESSRHGRIVLWQETFKYILQKPIFGIGPGMLTTYLTPFASARRWATADSIVLPHNVFLTYWAETGTFGLLILLWLLFKSIKFALKAWRIVQKTQQGYFIIILLAVAVAAVVFGVFTNRLADWFFVILAVLAVASRLSFSNEIKRGSNIGTV